MDETREFVAKNGAELFSGTVAETKVLIDKEEIKDGRNTGGSRRLSRNYAFFAPAVARWLGPAQSHAGRVRRR
jgi:hypothetical protein